MLADRQTDRHTDTDTQSCSLQYIDTAAAGEVINKRILEQRIILYLVNIYTFQHDVKRRHFVQSIVAAV